MSTTTKGNSGGVKRKVTDTLVGKQGVPGNTREDNPVAVPVKKDGESRAVGGRVGENSERKKHRGRREGVCGQGPEHKIPKNLDHFSICACHPCAGAMLIFSVSFQFYQMSPKRRRCCNASVYNLFFL
jgi:hypothetical protein